MKIHLTDIPEHGEIWLINRTTGELNDCLTPILGKQDFEIRMEIRPLQPETYEFFGYVSTERPEDCSRCGVNYPHEVDIKFREILIPALGKERKTQYAKANHFSELIYAEDQDVIEIEGGVLDSGEFLTELIELAVSPFPAPPLDGQMKCQFCHKEVKEGAFDFDEPFNEVQKSPLSEALKKWKPTLS